MKNLKSGKKKKNGILRSIDDIRNEMAKKFHVFAEVHHILNMDRTGTGTKGKLGKLPRLVGPMMKMGPTEADFRKKGIQRLKIKSKGE